jgi:hypothetical protein
LIPLKPQHDTRFVAVSPKGEWVATGSHGSTDVYVKIWEARTGRHVADLPVESSSLVGFSPDGRWLLTTGGGCRLCSVGTWREGPKIGGELGAFAFSPDSKVLAVEAGSGTVLLLDPDTGREYARLEDPNQDRAGALTFSTDGSQLFASTHDSPAVHVWDLRAIRAELAKRGLDWDLPPYPEHGDPKDAPPLRVDVVSQDGALAHVKLGEWEQAASIFALLVEADPNEHWYWYRSATLSLQTGKREVYRRICREMLTRFCNTDDPYVAERVAKICSLAPGAVSDLAPVLKLADRAVTGTEKHGGYRWFVLAKGLVEYRAGHYGAAVDWLNRVSPKADGGEWDAAAFAVLAMAKHGLGLAPGADAARLAEEARSALSHGLAILSKMPDPKAGRPFGEQWPFSVDAFDAWLHAQILVHEAEKLLGKDEK